MVVVLVSGPAPSGSSELPVAFRSSSVALGRPSSPESRIELLLTSSHTRFPTAYFATNPKSIVWSSCPAAPSMNSDDRDVVGAAVGVATPFESESAAVLSPVAGAAIAAVGSRPASGLVFEPPSGTSTRYCAPDVIVTPYFAEAVDVPGPFENE